MDDLSLKTQIESYANDYMNFMGITSFPTYSLQTRKASLELVLARGFGSVASASYQSLTDSHILSVCTNVDVPKYIIYHELTHILDTEQYAKNSVFRYTGLSGYTEYHASQVELMYLLGADFANGTVSFKMDSVIDTIAEQKKVAQYVEEKRHLVNELFSRENFPTDIEMLKTAFGILFNYWGVRSICEMYSVDYSEKIDNSIFLKFISTYDFVAMNNLMHGWLNNSQIEISMTVYLNTVFHLINEFKLS